MTYRCLPFGGGGVELGRGTKGRVVGVGVGVGWGVDCFSKGPISRLCSRGEKKTKDMEPQIPGDQKTAG